MGLGPDAAIVASHAALIMVLLLVIARIGSFMARPELPVIALKRDLLVYLGLFCWVLVIERAYYVAARLLKGVGVDLWSAHPAPALLSTVVVLGALGLKVSLLRAAFPGPAAMRRVAGDLCAVLIVWLMLFWGLR
jgi:hypothetical protein